MDKLENILEALLFLSGDALQIKEIAAKLNIKEKEVQKAGEELRVKYGGASGIHIMQFNGKLQLSSNPDYAPIVDSVLNPIKERELSKAMMEVSSIIAYKQPVTRMEIEEIRGVNSDYALTMLLKHNIIEVIGRKDTIGKPLLYGTTDEFLKRFQLSSLDDLPDYDDIINRIKILQSDEPKDLYHRSSNESGGQNVQDYGVVPESGDETLTGEIPDFLKNEKDIKIIK